MALQGAQIALSTTATSLVGNATHGVIRVVLRNLGTGAAYLGGSDVTTTLGYQLSTADSPLSLTLVVGEQLFGTSTGTPTVHVLRMNDTT